MNGLNVLSKARGSSILLEITISRSDSDQFVSFQAGSDSTKQLNSYIILSASFYCL